MTATAVLTQGTLQKWMEHLILTVTSQGDKSLRFYNLGPKHPPKWSWGSSYVSPFQNMRWGQGVRPYLRRSLADCRLRRYPEVVAKIDQPSPITVRSQLLHIASRERKDSPPPPRFHEVGPTEKTLKTSMHLLYQHDYLSLALALVLKLSQNKNGQKIVQLHHF